MKVLFADVDPAAVDPWRWQPHPEVWMVVGAIVALGLYVTRVIAPKIPVHELDGDRAVTRANKAWFVAGVVVLWLSADWPLHDLAEQQLYALHMVQHFLLTMVVPPMFLLSVPAWLARLAFPKEGRGWAVVSRLARPVPAAVIFNGLLLATHWTVVVNTSVRVAAVHYTVHLVVVASAFLMWTPICGPWKELRLGPAGTCVYLFAQSILPTLPGAFLTLAETPVYEVYDHLPRLWGITVLEDQQFAGLVMKLGEAAYMWGLIVVVFFRWALAQERTDRRINLVRIEDGIAYRGPAPTATSPPAPSAAGPDRFAEDLERISPARTEP